VPDALAGVRVLDLSTGPVGGLATTVLADFGADVVKLEPPGGDRFRSLAAAPLWLRGKRSVELDLTRDAGRDRLARLAEGADVLVVSGPPDRAVRLGADAARLAERNPALVHCSITGWGARGPYAAWPGYEPLVAARSGRMASFTGQRAREGPAYAAVAVASHATAQGAVQGILAALIARERTGLGQRVETSLLQGLLPYDLAGLLLVQLIEAGAPAPDPAAMGGGMPTLNYHPVATADGRWIQLGNLLEHLFFAFLDAIDLLPELLADERFQASPASWPPDVVEEARDRILLRMQERSADEWMQLFRADGNVAAEPYLTTQQALDHPELVAAKCAPRRRPPVVRWPASRCSSSPPSSPPRSARACSPTSARA
jgi:crotonobetainyl-CoA:carnitine CoA-transferase CaiB-like acyl-CoA transferase